MFSPADAFERFAARARQLVEAAELSWLPLHGRELVPAEIERDGVVVAGGAIAVDVDDVRRSDDIEGPAGETAGIDQLEERAGTNEDGVMAGQFHGVRLGRIGVAETHIQMAVEDHGDLRDDGVDVNSRRATGFDLTDRHAEVVEQSDRQAALDVVRVEQWIDEGVVRDSVSRTGTKRSLHGRRPAPATGSGGDALA